MDGRGGGGKLDWLLLAKYAILIERGGRIIYGERRFACSTY